MKCQFVEEKRRREEKEREREMRKKEMVKPIFRMIKFPIEKVLTSDGQRFKSAGQ